MTVAAIIRVVDHAVNWLATNARSFSYVLPDSLELALYLCIAAYFAIHVAQQQV